MLFRSMGIGPAASERACEWLATAFKPAGDYAVKQDRGSIRIVFEWDDAQVRVVA